MGCWHGWHGCGPWYGPPYGAEWYGPPDRAEEPARAGRRRRGRREDEEAAEDLEARLADLRVKVRVMEEELARLGGREDTTAEGR